MGTLRLEGILEKKECITTTDQGIIVKHCKNSLSIAHMVVTTSSGGISSKWNEATNAGTRHQENTSGNIYISAVKSAGKNKFIIITFMVNASATTF